MILLVGAPGSGKSVQAKMIEAEANVAWLSMGELLRKNISEEQRERMEHGELLNDAEVEDILADAIHSVSNGSRILIDGFPRRDSQVHWFRGFTKAARRNLEAIIHIIVPEEVVQERLQARARLDDQPDIISKRYKQYQDEIVPMIEHMQARGTRLIEIDGNRAPEEIHREIMKQLKGVI